MRADRLVATLLLLQARGRVTAAEVADELEVSVKTARRDLEALSMAGIPVYSQSGRHGGWSLVGGARTDLSGLTAAEARALFLLAGPAAALTPEAKTALRKLVQALPETFRSAAEAAAQAIVLDPAGWGDRPRADPPHLEVLQHAVVDALQVRLGYSDRRRQQSVRTVHPLGLVEKGSVWYLVAGTEAGMRTFRLSRIGSVEVTGDPVERPPDFDLAAAWQRTVATVEEHRTAVRAVVRVDAMAVGPLREQFGTGFKIIDGELPDGRVEVEIAMPYPNRIAEQLAGWGGHVEVVGPPEVRELLAEIGAQLVARYS
jgi:predicted DNA-binding transcriptional regulator YafY